MSPTSFDSPSRRDNHERTALVALSSCGLQIPGDVDALAPSPVGRGCRTTALSTQWLSDKCCQWHGSVTPDGDVRCHGVSAWTMTMIQPSARESSPSPSPQPGAGPQAGPGPRRRTRLSPRPAHWHSLTRSAAPPRRSERLRRAAAQAEWPVVHRTLRTRLAQVYASSCRSLGRNRGPGLKLEANSWRALRKCELRAEECQWTPQGRGPVLRTSESATPDRRST
jgi:hypothetical protein